MNSRCQRRFSRESNTQGFFFYAQPGKRTNATVPPPTASSNLLTRKQQSHKLKTGRTQSSESRCSSGPSDQTHQETGWISATPTEPCGLGGDAHGSISNVPAGKMWSGGVCWTTWTECSSWWTRSSTAGESDDGTGALTSLRLRYRVCQLRSLLHRQDDVAAE